MLSVLNQPLIVYPLGRIKIIANSESALVIEEKSNLVIFIANSVMPRYNKNRGEEGREEGRRRGTGECLNAILYCLSTYSINLI